MIDIIVAKKDIKFSKVHINEWGAETVQFCSSFVTLAATNS